KLDSIILVSGDGDYEPLVNYLQENKGCYVEVYAFGRTASARIIDKANEFHDMDKNDSFLIQPRRRGQKVAPNVSDDVSPEIVAATLHPTEPSASPAKDSTETPSAKPA